MMNEILDIVLEKLDKIHEDIREIKEKQEDYDKQFIINVVADWAAELFPIKNLIGRS
jgi:hypothetical protein